MSNYISFGIGLEGRGTLNNKLVFWASFLLAMSFKGCTRGADVCDINEGYQGINTTP
jgi:hypothetical protein